MIYIYASRRSCAAIPIQADPLADLLVGPWVVVCPGDQLLVDPGQQRDGAIREHGADGLGSGPHHMKVVTAIVLIVLGSLQAGLFLWRVQVKHVRCEEPHEAEWGFCQRRWHGEDEVEMQRQH